MKTFRKRFLSAMCMVAFGVSFAIAQTSTIKHTVDRGETLQSIAKRYATTEAKIVELNPDAKQFVYVGMVLTIPVEKVTNVTKEEKGSLQNDFKQNTYNQITGIAVSDERDFYRWSFVGSIAYGILPKSKEECVSGSNFTLLFSLGANYNITKSFFVGARIGYNTVNTNTLLHSGVAEYYNVITNNHMIFMPLEIGYKFCLKDNEIALVPYAGTDINCIVKCTTETGVGTHKEKRTIDPDKRLGVNGRIGLRLSLYGFSVGGSYVLSFDDNYGENKGFPEISIGFTM